MSLNQKEANRERYRAVAKATRAIEDLRRCLHDIEREFARTRLLTRMIVSNMGLYATDLASAAGALSALSYAGSTTPEDRSNEDREIVAVCGDDPAPTAARRPTFYIATRGAAAYLPRVRALAGALTAAGYKWTHDWTKTIDEADARGITSDRQLPLDEQISVARVDKAAVLEADILVYLSPDEHHRSEGAAWELGLHHARCLYEGGFSVVVGTPNCLFARLADRQVKSDSDVLGVVADLLSDGRLLRVLLSPPEGA